MPTARCSRGWRMKFSAGTVPSPHVPANIAEILYVSLRHVLDYVEEHGTYPQRMVDNMRKLVGAYDRQRTKALGAQNISPDATRRYTGMAAFALARWLDTQAAREQVTQEDFDKWAEELTSDTDDA